MTGTGAWTPSSLTPGRLTLGSVFYTDPQSFPGEVRQQSPAVVAVLIMWHLLPVFTSLSYFPHRHPPWCFPSPPKQTTCTSVTVSRSASGETPTQKHAYSVPIYLYFPRLIYMRVMIVFLFHIGEKYSPWKAVSSTLGADRTLWERWVLTFLVSLFFLVTVDVLLQHGRINKISISMLTFRFEYNIF